MFGFDLVESADEEGAKRANILTQQNHRKSHGFGRISGVHEIRDIVRNCSNL